MSKQRGVVHIMRGPAGAGKSHFTALIPSTVCSADHFWEYHGIEFDSARLAEAHSWCELQFALALHARKPVIVVDNTGIHAWEWRKYAAIAKLVDYDVVINEFVPHTIEGIRICRDRNVHSVPPRTVYAMAIEFEPVAPSEPFVDNVIQHSIQRAPS